MQKMPGFGWKAMTPSRKEAPSQQINSLYHEFESLKSQIYSSKSHKKENSPEKKWDRSQHYYEAQSNLRESTIRKYSKQFKEQLQLIKQSKKQITQKQSHPFSRQLFAPPSLELEQSPHHKPKDDRIENYFAFFKQKISGHPQRSHWKPDILANVLQSYTNTKQSGESRSAREAKVAEVVQRNLREYQGYQSEVLGMLVEQLAFFNKKMGCLEKIIAECSKIIKLNNDNRRARELNEQVLVISLRNIENRYEHEIKQLVSHYEHKIAQLNKPHTHTHNLTYGLSHKDNGYVEGLAEENSQLKVRLEQCRKVLQSKQELIASLQEQNAQLKKQIMLKTSNQKQDLSLGYSVTGRKIKISNDKMNSSQAENNKWEGLQQAEELINFNELESVREKSFEEWDISHLEIRQNTNTKSMAGDFKEIYDDSIDESQ